MTGRIAVGKDIDSWCTRCKLMLAHTVETMIGSKITRVHCNTCGSQHAYRAQPPGTASAPGRRSAGTSTPRVVRLAPAPADEYARLLDGRDRTAARPYTPQERFAANDLLTHPTFGLGIVTTLKERTKIEVVFRDGVKTLLHGC